MLIINSNIFLIFYIFAARCNTACNAYAAIQKQHYNIFSVSAVNISRVYLVALARVPDSKARAGFRKTFCLKCICSALKKMSTGEYFDTAGYSARYLRCFYRYKCKSVSEHFQLLARRFVNILINCTFKGKISNLCSAIRVIFKLKEKKEKKKKKKDKEQRRVVELRNPGQEPLKLLYSIYIYNRYLEILSIDFETCKYQFENIILYRL